MSEPTENKMPDKNSSIWDFLTMVLVNPLVLIALCFLMCFCLVVLYSARQIGVKKIGDAIVFEDLNKKIITYNFSTSQLWEKVGDGGEGGYFFSANQKLKISASGKYHTAIHHLVDYANTDVDMIYPWIGADGISSDDLDARSVDFFRHKYSIIPGGADSGINYGALVAKIDYANEKDDIIYIGLHKSIQLKDNANIYFAVNEPILNKSKKDIYVVDKKIDPEYYRKHFEKKTGNGKWVDVSTEVWEKVKKNPRLKSLWFDDNIGNFLITIEIDK